MFLYNTTKYQELFLLSVFFQDARCQEHQFTTDIQEVRTKFNALF